MPTNDSEAPYREEALFVYLSTWLSKHGPCNARIHRGGVARPEVEATCADPAAGSVILLETLSCSCI